MMDRRDFILRAAGLGAALGLGGCGSEPGLPFGVPRLVGTQPDEVMLYDLYAMALYMDGGLGPRTGIIKVEYVLADKPVELEFWHGHGGKSHFFTVKPEHFAEMKRLRKVTLQTTEIASHSHKLFIDTSDPKWRVPGAKPTPVPLP